MSSSLDQDAGRSRWWLAEVGRSPLGPVDGQLLMEWLTAGLVPPDALVCEVGGQSWRPIGDLPRLVPSPEQPRSRFDRSAENCMLDIEPLPPDPEFESEAPASRRRGSSAPPSSEQRVRDACTEVTSVAVPKPARIGSFGAPRPKASS